MRVTNFIANKTHINTHKHRVFISQSLLVLSCLSTSFSVSAAPSLVHGVQGIPASIQNQICRDLSPDKKACGIDDIIYYIDSLALDNDEVLLLFFLKDKTSRYHRSLTIPVKINATGEWITGTAFLGEPRDVVAKKGWKSHNLWMHAQFNKLGKTPILLKSKQGLDWTSVALPHINGASYQSTDITKLCFSGKDLFLSLQSIRGKDQSSTSYWSANQSKLLASSASASKLWKPINKKQFLAKRCDTAKPVKNKWLIQQGETLTLLFQEASGLAIKVPHKTLTTVLNGSTSVANNKQEPRKKIASTATKKETPANNKIASKKTGFNIQVAAYSNDLLVKKLVTQLKKAHFKGFSKAFQSNGKKINRVYVGPFPDRKTASTRLVDLKKIFKGTGVSSAFVTTIK